ncbi:MAG: TIGR04282 family arsenosugar biosynthesis glycosyltransferase [Thermodesulfobacteriota bacterium]
MKGPGPNALAVMLKAPVAGFVKTRLSPPLTPRQAAGLYECFIKDTFATAASLEGVDLFAACMGPGQRLKGLLPEGVAAFPQEGDGLGERMYNILKRLFSLGYGRVAIMGSDIPDLPETHITAAFGLLEAGAGLVLGPVEDGGYCLLAVDAPYETLFKGIRYSTPSVLAETLERARASSIGYRLLETWHDIDTFEDLQLLKANPGAPESSRFVKGLLP